MGAKVTTPEKDELPPLDGIYYPSNAGWILYWIIFGLMIGSALCFAALTFRKPQHDRKHGYLTTLIVLTAGVAYYTMASQGGDTEIRLYWQKNQARDVFYARYVDWFVTTPLLLLDLLLIAGVPVGTTLWIITADIFMILLGLFGATSTKKFRWGWYGISCFMELVISFGLFWTGRRCAYRRSPQIGLYYTLFATFLTVVWWGYPVCWGLAEGSSTISMDAEIAFYGGLDIVSKVVFGWLLMLTSGVITRQIEIERAEGKMYPSLLEVPINAPLPAARAMNVGALRERNKACSLAGVTKSVAPAADEQVTTSEAPATDPVTATENITPHQRVEVV